MPPQRLGDYLRDFDKLIKFPEDNHSFAHAADLCLSYGGSLSGEHGDGQAKGAAALALVAGFLVTRRFIRRAL